MNYYYEAILKKSLFQIAAWGFQDPGGKERKFFLFFKNKLIKLSN